MNSCILMVKIVRNPELRYTQDTQTPIAEMLVEFPGLREEDPPATLKVVGWGNLASEIKDTYSSGDRVIIQGSLRMNTIDRPEGFKEKRAELTASRIYKIESQGMPTTPSPEPIAEPVMANSSNVVDFDSFKSTPPEYEDPALGVSVGSRTDQSPSAPPPMPTSPEADQDLDDIPF